LTTRWLRRGLLALLVLFLVTVAGALVYLTGPAGEARVRALLLEQANTLLAGRVELEGLELSLSSVTLTGLKLYDPEGELVAEVERVEAEVALAPLLRQHVKLHSVRVEQPHLYLHQDTRGLNLTRALALKQPQPEKPDTGPGSFALSVRGLALSDGSVDYTAEEESGTREVRLEAVDATGEASYEAATEKLAVTLETTSSLARPLEGPVRLSLKGGGENGSLAADVALSAPGLELKGRGALEGEGQSRAEVEVLRLTPELARTLVPEYPLAVPLTLSGTVALAGDTLRVALEGEAAGGSAGVEGSLDVARLHTEGLTARVRGVDLATLLGGGPRTELAGDLRVRGGGTRLETLEGEVDLTLAPSSIAGRPLGPVELHASAKEGQLHLSQLDARAPGARLTASGGGTLEDLRLKGQLVASNLDAFAHTVGRLGDGKPLPLSGRGALDFTLTGPARHPAVSLSGGFDALAYEDYAVQGLTLEARVPDVTQPLTTDATLKAASLSAAGRTWEDMDASLVTRGRALTATVKAGGSAQLLLALTGTVDEDKQGLALSSFSLSYPEASWTLEHPTHLGFGSGVRVDPLTLTAGPQSLTLALTTNGENLDARTELRTVDLGLLPKALLPPSLQELGGRLSGHVAVSGHTSHPSATATLSLEDGRFQRYAGVDLALKGRYVRDRATGTLSASAPAGRLSADFDVPVEGLQQRRREPVRLELTLEHVDVGPALRMAGQPDSATGFLSGTLKVWGPASEPGLELALRGSELRYWGLPSMRKSPPVVMAPGALPPALLDAPLGFELLARSGEQDGALTVRLDARNVGEQAWLVLHTPFTLGQLLSQPPTAQQVLETPVRLEANVREAPLALLSRLGLVERARGRVSVLADLTGPLLAPEGRLDVLAEQVSVQGSAPVNGNLNVLTSGEDVRVLLAARREELLLADVKATFEAPLAALQDQEVVGRVPFTLSGRAGPIPLAEVPGLEAQSSVGEEGLHGVLSLNLSARGTLDAPEVKLTTGVQQLGVGALALGQGRLYYAYDDARSMLDALLTSENGGTLLVRGQVPQALSLEQLKRGVDFSRVPLEADVEARRFDISTLSGVVPLVRSLRGELRADGRVAGTLGAPTWKGELQWKDGRLALDGYGEYQDVQVALDVTDQRLELKKLSARSGGGTLEFSARADLGASGQFALTGQGRMRDFPLVYDDQLLALLTLRTELKGDVSSRFVNLHDISLPEVHVTLPEAKRKDLQSLDRPDGIVLVRDGVPLEKRRSKKAAASNDVTPDSGTGGTGDSEEARRRYVMKVNAPRNLWVRGSDINAELGLSPDFTIDYEDETAISGTVKVLRGELEVLGRRFDVQRSSEVRFTGPPRKPYINATAEHENESAGVKVFVTVRGQGKDFTLKPTSEPALSESEIYTLLATGRRTLKAGSGASMNQGQVASVLGSLLASQARKALAQKLPLDVLSIEAGEEGITDARLEVGKYLTDELYLGYNGRLGGTSGSSSNSTTRRENDHAVRLEYQFSPRWGIEAEYGDAQKGGADIIWSREY